MFDEITKKYGGVDILVNNSGVALWSPFMEITEELWDKTLDINLKGTFLCSQAAARQMIPRDGGVIVNIGINCFSRFNGLLGTILCIKGRYGSSYQMFSC